MDGMDKLDAVDGKAPEKKSGKPVKCKLQFSGIIRYGRASRKVNGRVYDLAIDDVTTVEAGDVEALKKVEPNLYIVV